MTYKQYLRYTVSISSLLIVRRLPPFTILPEVILTLLNAPCWHTEDRRPSPNCPGFPTMRPAKTATRTNGPWPHDACIESRPSRTATYSFRYIERIKGRAMEWCFVSACFIHNRSATLLMECNGRVLLRPGNYDLRHGITARKCAFFFIYTLLEKFQVQMNK